LVTSVANTASQGSSLTLGDAVDADADPTAVPPLTDVSGAHITAQNAQSYPPPVHRGLGAKNIDQLLATWKIIALGMILLAILDFLVLHRRMNALRDVSFALLCRSLTCDCQCRIMMQESLVIYAKHHARLEMVEARPT
jgi:hypothetical protein